MKLYDIYPIALHEKPDEYIHGFLNALFMRTSFSLRDLQGLGWKGINPLRRAGRGWTFSIDSREGIYGLAQATSHPSPEDRISRYNLYYFPDVNRATLGKDPESLRQCDHYYAVVRDFTCYPEFYPHFLAGEIEIYLPDSGRSLWMTLNIAESTSCQSVFRGRGSNGSADSEGGSLFDISFPFFAKVAATLNHNLDSLPSAASYVYPDPVEEESPGSEAEGQVVEEESPGIKVEGQNVEKENPDGGITGEASFISLSVGYGDADFERHFSESGSFRNDNLVADFWKKGYRKERPFPGSMLWYSARRNDSEKRNETGGPDERKTGMIMLTGFLGSGKTTFLSHLIEYYVSRNKFVAVIQNEIGPAGLDARLLEDQYAVLEMDEGCVCCSLAGELRKGIIRITEEINPDLIVLETTGLANPYNLTGDLDTISDLVRLEKIITLVDGENYLSMELASGIVTDQIRSADTLVINKCDRINNQKAEEIVKRLVEINPSARIVRCSHGDVNIAGLMHPEGVSEPKTSGSRSWIEAEEGHHQTHADENIRARKITLSEPLNKDKLLSNMEVITQHAFRIKGVLDFLGDDCPWLLQAVNGRWELKEMRHHVPDERFLIVISKDDVTVNLLDTLLLTKTINYEKINELSCCADGDCVGSL